MSNLELKKALEFKKINFIRLKTIFFEIVETFIVSFVVIFLIYKFVASVEVVSGASMEPTFDSFDRILVDKITPKGISYQRGDIVVLIPPTEKSKHYIKRIIGVPGDIFKIYECKVFISTGQGQYVLKEDYTWQGVCTLGGSSIKEGRSLRLGDGEFVVLGDNREHSIDSRVFGVVTVKNLLGKVVFRLWPIKRIGFI